MTYNTKRLTPPSVFYNHRLAELNHALMHYTGTDRYSHPYRDTQETDIGAAVLVLITNEPNPHLLLTKRSHKLTAHAGEISFVGGRRDSGDSDAAHTALREAREEIGLNEQLVHLIGYLPCQTAKSGILVRPVVAVIDESAIKQLVGAEDEIERIFWVRLEHFIATSPSEVVMAYDAAPPFATPAWQVDNEVVWGLTGRIIANLVEIGFGVRWRWYYRLVD